MFPAKAIPRPQWRSATVPGDVHLDLLANKLIPEPFYRDNEAKLQWIQDADWEYRTNIDAASTLLARRHIDLVFEGLDAYAEVYLNSQKILVADNMFREWRVDVKPYLKAGANELLVVFPSPIKTAQKIALTDVWHGQTPAQDKTYLRKAAYEYGWDWGPTFVTSGIWRPARLEAWDDARIADFYPHVRDVTSALAHVDAELDVISSVSSQSHHRAGLQGRQPNRAAEADRQSRSRHSTISFFPSRYRIRTSGIPPVTEPSLSTYGVRNFQSTARPPIRHPARPACDPSSFVATSTSGDGPSSSS